MYCNECPHQSAIWIINELPCSLSGSSSVYACWINQTHLAVIKYSVILSALNKAVQWRTQEQTMDQAHICPTATANKITLTVNVFYSQGRGSMCYYSYDIFVLTIFDCNCCYEIITYSILLIVEMFLHLWKDSFIWKNKTILRTYKVCWWNKTSPFADSFSRCGEEES